MSCLSTAAAAAGGFAAEVRRGTVADIDPATGGPRTFWSDYKEVQHTC